MNDAPEILLAHHLKALKLPTLPHASIRNWPGPGGAGRQSLCASAQGVRRKMWTMSDTWHGLSNWN